MKRREMTVAAAAAAAAASDPLSDDDAQHGGDSVRAAIALNTAARAATTSASPSLMSAQPVLSSFSSSSSSSPSNASGGGNGASNGSAPLTVKKRRTKNFEWREDMAKSRGSISVCVPPLDPPTFETWDDFTSAWKKYQSATKTLFRRRSSSTTTSWNSKNRFKKFPVPDEFQYATMAYWCTHGCIQPSRGTGVRAHLHNRFTGCTARITADVVYETNEANEVRWFIRVRNQISHHNHKISDEIYNCYTNNSSVPDELLLGPSEEMEEPAGPTSSSSPSQVMRSFESAEENDFENSSHILAEMEDVDHVSPDSSSAASAYKLNQRVPATASALTAKAATIEDRKIQMARAELQPILADLKRTSTRVIHKRLQDVSEVVTHLLAKWERDRIVEEQIFSSTRVTLVGGNLPEEDTQREQQQQPSTGIYGDGPGALLSHRLDTFSGELVRSTSSALANDGNASNNTVGERPGNSSNSAVPVDDDELSRHRGQSELV